MAKPGRRRRSSAFFQKLGFGLRNFSREKPGSLSHQSCEAGSSYFFAPKAKKPAHFWLLAYMGRFCTNKYITSLVPLKAGRPSMRFGGDSGSTSLWFVGIGRRPQFFGKKQWKGWTVLHFLKRWGWKFLLIIDECGMPTRKRRPLFIW